MGQMLSQVGQQAGQLGQMAQSAGAPLQGLAQPLQQLPQQVMQGVQQIVEKATQAGEPKDADAAQARDEARPGETATGGRAPNQDNQHRETSPRDL